MLADIQVSFVLAVDPGSFSMMQDDGC